LLHEVAQLFIGDYPTSLAEIRLAIEEQDPAKLERAAHTLKGSVANFGAAATVDSAFSMEKMGRSGKIDAAPAELVRLEASLRRLIPELEGL